MPSPVLAENLSDLAGIKHGFFTRAGGVSQGIYASLNCGPGSRDDPEAVKQNRARVALYLGAHEPEVVTPYQVHSAQAIIIDEAFPPGERPRADAVVTKTPGLPIGILTADCGPVLLADPQARVVAAAHAGWRGAMSGILDATLLAMETLGAERRRIHAALGPCINQPSYEVGQEFLDQFIAADAAAARFFQIPAGATRPHFDLPAFITSDLRTRGLASVVSEARCTYTDESNFFSFRRTTHRSEGDYGRQISAILVA